MGVIRSLSNAVGKIVMSIGKVFGLQPDPSIPDTPYNQNLMTNETAPTSFIGVVYGNRRKAGVRIGTFTMGEGNKYLYAVYALSHGPVASISNPMMDDVLFTDPEISKFVTWSYGLGDLNQDATTNYLIQELGSYNWDQVNGKLQGVAFAIVKLTLDKDHMTNFGNITFDIQGRLVFDPRDNTTKWSDNPALCVLDYQRDTIYGKGVPYPQGFDVASYIDAANYFDENPAAAVPAIVGGCWLSGASRNGGFFGAQKSLFDQLIAGEIYEVRDNTTNTLLLRGALTSKSFTPLPAVGNGREFDPDLGDIAELRKYTYKLNFNGLKGTSFPVFNDTVATQLSFKQIKIRYSCNGNVDTSQTIYDNLKALSTSFNGVITFINGLSTILPDRPEPVSATFDSSNITSDISISLPDKSTQLNEITGTWFDPEHGYDQMTRTVKNETFLKRDAGRPQSKDINMPFCNNPLQVDRILTIEINKSRHSGLVQFKTLWSALDVFAGNVVSVTDDDLTWNNKLFRVLKIGIPNIYDDVTITCIPYDANDYIEGTFNERTAREYLAKPIKNEFPLPTNLTVQRVQDSVDKALQVTWTESTLFEAKYYTLMVYSVLRDPNTLTILSYTLVKTYENIYGSSYFIYEPLVDGTEYEFRIFVHNTNNKRSITYETALYVYGKLSPPTGISVKIVSPWAIEARPTYGAGDTGQLKLTHIWYIAEHVDPVQDPMPVFTDAVEIYRGPILYWNGVKPEKTYYIWCQAANDFEQTDVALGHMDTVTDPANPRWVIDNGQVVVMPAVTNDDIGVNVNTLKLQSDAQVFSYDGNGAITPAAINFTAYPSNIDTTVDPLVFTTVPSVTLTGTGNSRVLTKEVFDAAAVESIAVTVATTSGSLSDTISIVKLIGGGKDGVDPLVGYLTNEAHTISADKLGNVTGNLADAGGTFKVYKGLTDVTLASAFSIVGTPTGIAVSINATTGVYAITAVTQDSGWVDFQAVHSGVTIVKRYTISKAKVGADGQSGLSAKLVSIASDNQAFLFDGNGSLKSASTINFTSSSQNLTSAIVWSTSPNVASGTGSTFSLTATQFASNTSVEVTASADGVSDKITIVRLIDGSDGSNGQDAISVILSNESHTIPTDSNGNNGNYAGSGTDIRVYQGATELAYDGVGISAGTWKVTPSATGITSGTISDSGNYATVGNHSAMTADVATVSYTITGKRTDGATISVIKVQSLSKSKDGANGANGQNGERGSKHFYRDVSSATINNAWTDSEAELAITSEGLTKVSRDQVTLYNQAAGYAETRYWNTVPATPVWSGVTQVIDGSLIVNGTVGANQIDVTSLFAQNITATGSITGGTMQTAVAGSGGLRVVMTDSGTYPFKIMNGTTTLFYVDGSGNMFFDGSLADATIDSTSMFSQELLDLFTSSGSGSSGSTTGGSVSVSNVSVSGTTASNQTLQIVSPNTTPVTIAVTLNDNAGSTSNPYTQPVWNITVRRDSTAGAIILNQNVYGEAGIDQEPNAPAFYTMNLYANVTFQDTSPTTGKYVLTVSRVSGSYRVPIIKTYSLNQAVEGGTTYTLPKASSSVLGGIKVGNNLSIDTAGVLSATGGSTYTHPTYTSYAPTLTGASVLASLTTDTQGHVTGATARTLTPANIGALPSGSKAADSSKLNGYYDNTGAVGNTIVRRTSGGYVYGTYFNMNNTGYTSSVATHMVVETSNDKFMRWQTPAQFIANHGISTSGHTHNTSDISGLDSALASKFTNGSALTCSSISISSSIKYKDVLYRESPYTSLQDVVSIGSKGVAVGSYKKDNEKVIHNFFIAEEVSEIDDKCVVKEDGEPIAIKTNDLLAKAYAAIAELTARVEYLEGKINGN